MGSSDAYNYNGDSKADPAVRSNLPSPAVAGYAKAGNGNEWIVMLSSGGYTPTHITILFEGYPPMAGY